MHSNAFAHPTDIVEAKEIENAVAESNQEQNKMVKLVGKMEQSVGNINRKIQTMQDKYVGKLKKITVGGLEKVRVNNSL